jgi:hypothetical protein
MTPNKLQPALLGGAFIGVLSALPVISAGNLCCCLWVIGGGVVAAYVMQQNHPEQIAVGDGALVGLFSGILGSFVYVLVSIPFTLMLGPLQRQMMESMMENTEGMTPELRSLMENFAGGTAGMLVGFIFMLLAGVVFATIGGVLGAVLFRKNLPPPTQVDVLPPQTPLP